MTHTAIDAEWLEGALAEVMAANAATTALLAIATKPDCISLETYQQMLVSGTKAVQHRFGPWGRLTLETFRNALARNLEGKDEPGAGVVAGSEGHAEAEVAAGKTA